MDESLLRRVVHALVEEDLLSEPEVVEVSAWDLLLALEARLEVARKVLRDHVRALDDAERDPGEVRDVGAERGARDAVDELVQEDQLWGNVASVGERYGVCAWERTDLLLLVIDERVHVHVPYVGMVGVVVRQRAVVRGEE